MNTSCVPPTLPHPMAAALSIVVLQNVTWLRREDKVDTFARSGSSSSVGVVGLGYVGLPLTEALNAVGHSVVGLDINEETVQGISAGTSHISDVPNASLKRMLATGFIASIDFSQLARVKTAII